MKQKMPPAHPGEILKELYLDPLEISVTEAAGRLGVTRKTLSQLINGRSGLSAEMAVRLSKALATTPELWLNMQQAYDLWEAEKKMQKIRIKPIRKSAGAFRRAS
jgi:addiction module HigA family antidote